MAPKGNKGKKTLDSSGDPVYAQKRAKNNEAVKKSRDKAKQKADETMVKVTELREGNKKLEGKIEEQKRTKKMLKNLFLEQTTRRMDKPTQDQLAMLDDSDDDEIPSDDSGSNASSSESSESEPEPPPARKRKVK